MLFAGVVDYILDGPMERNLLFLSTVHQNSFFVKSSTLSISSLSIQWLMGSRIMHRSDGFPIVSRDYSWLQGFLILTTMVRSPFVVKFCDLEETQEILLELNFIAAIYFSKLLNFKEGLFSHLQIKKWYYLSEILL